ncbi:MAG: shikimate kinase [Azospirillaceae bacterium]|nr:shikimate kinase [Azospirillaceae bacterium]
MRPTLNQRPPRTLVLVGLMGAGKTSIGRRLASRLGLPFVDADQEIERAAGCSIPEFFDRYGEPAFREGERRVISRLLDQPLQVLSTGGGAFMDADTRALVGQRALSIWLRAELDLLVQRTARRGTRPLLKDSDPRETLRQLMELRHPYYAQADIIVDSGDRPAEDTVDRVVEALQHYLDNDTPAGNGPSPLEALPLAAAVEP